jgi:predicted transcriptional regulator YheO
VQEIINTTTSGGRKRDRSEALDEKKTQLLYQLYDELMHTVKEICDILDISRSTLFAYLHRREETMVGFQKVEQS